MKLEYLKSFIGVVNNKSFSVAAKELFISQPTISTHIKNLEAELGVQLLVRSTKDVMLSDAGHVFYPYAVKLLATEEEALTMLNKGSAVMKGTVTIASSSVPANGILPGFIVLARQNNPEVNYKIVEGNSADVIKSVLHFEADFGIGGLKTNNEKCICEPLLKDRMVIITPNEKKYQDMRGVFPLERLKDETFVVRTEGSGTQMVSESIERKLGICDKRLNIAYRAETSELVKRGVEKGLGIALISYLSVENSVKEGRILKFDLPAEDAKRDFYLIYHKEKMMSMSSTNTIKLLKNYCRNYQG